MSDNFLNTQIDWNNTDSLIDKTEPTGGKRHFGFLRLYVAGVTKSWEKGASFTIPGVVGGDYNEKDANGNMLLKSYRAGGNDKLFVFVLTKESQEGQPYQMVKQYPSRRYRKGEPLIMSDIIFPALKQLTPAQKDKLISTGSHIAFDEVPTGETFTPQGETKEREVMCWPAGEIVLFDTKEAMKAAEAEFFDGMGGNNTVIESIYPANWIDDQGNLKPDIESHVKKVIAEKGMDAGKAELIPFADNTTRDGKPVDKNAVIAAIVG